ncbi:MAG TPA: GGDEF domain-containing protein [Rhodoblastus sp.]|nr:GGDEF domain-containing protein [Rhodoblastus sp.]
MRVLDLKSWFFWCALAGFGVVLPLMLSNNPDLVLVVRLLRGLGAAAFVIALVGLIRSTGEAVAPSDAAYEPPPPAPRTLSGNPLAIDAGAKPLAERIDDAIEACSAYDCTVGVIYYNFDSYREIARTQGVAAAEAAMDFVANMLQIVLRDSDRIERLGRGRFAVCVVLLKEREALLNVERRVKRAIRNMRLEALRGEAIAHDEGTAIYPIQGADGAALIARAQAECDAAHGRRLRDIARIRKTESSRVRAA